MKTKKEKFQIYLESEIQFLSKTPEEFKSKLLKLNDYNLIDAIKWESKAVVRDSHKCYILKIIDKQFQEEGFEKVQESINYWIERIHDNLKRLEVANSTGIFHNAVNLTTLKAEADMLSTLDYLLQQTKRD